MIQLNNDTTTTVFTNIIIILHYYNSLLWPFSTSSAPVIPVTVRSLSCSLRSVSMMTLHTLTTRSLWSRDSAQLVVQVSSFHHSYLHKCYRCSNPLDLSTRTFGKTPRPLARYITDHQGAGRGLHLSATHHDSSLLLLKTNRCGATLYYIIKKINVLEHEPSKYYYFY